MNEKNTSPVAQVARIGRRISVLCWVLGWGVIVGGGGPAWGAGVVINKQQYIDWGVQVYQETVRTLGIAKTRLFAETAQSNGRQSGGDGGKAYVWPMSTQFRVQNSLAQLNPTTYGPVLREFSDQLYASYWSSKGGGYRSGVSAGSDRYYDDNAHIAVALAEAYDITHEAVYLNRAKETLAFVMSGESTAGGGGIYWRERDYSFKDSIATLQGARAALMIHQATGEQKYLDDATRLYGWAKRTTQQWDGLFMEKLYLTGPNAGRVGDYTLVNGAGMGISANLEFYDSTKNMAYLKEAERIAERSISRYFDGAMIRDEGYWAYELVDALDDLYLRDGNEKWLKAVDGGLQWLHRYKQDPKGHYGKFWGRDGVQSGVLGAWNLNDQAAVAEAYLHTGLVPEPGMGWMVIALGAWGMGRRRAEKP